MPIDKSPDYAKIRQPLLRRIMGCPLPALISHWTFQSLFYMDNTERLFKLGLDVVLTAGIAYLLKPWMPWRAALLAAFIIAHTLNFLFNGHLWGLLKNYGLVQTTREAFERYVHGLSWRARQERSIQHLYVYGSLARQEWSASSDLDARLVRRPGFVYALRACWFVLCERSRALVARFPLDLYVIDRTNNLHNLRSDEKAVDLIGPSTFMRVILPTSNPDSH